MRFRKKVSELVFSNKKSDVSKIRKLSKKLWFVACHRLDDTLYMATYNFLLDISVVILSWIKPFERLCVLFTGQTWSEK